MENKWVINVLLVIIMILVIVACIVITAVAALAIGSAETELFDFGSLNISNMIPVFIIGGFICCVTVGILVLFLGRDIYAEIISKNSNSDKNGGNEK